MYPGCTRNYISDPDAWFSVFKVSGDERGPAVAGAVGDAARADRRRADEPGRDRAAAAALPARRTGAYDIVHRNLYNVHQRVAASFRKGRVFLAGDCRARQQSARRARPQFRHPRRGRIDHAARPGDPPRGAGERPRRVRPAPPAAEHRVRPAADHRQQEAHGREGPGGARARTRTSFAAPPRIRRRTAPMCAARRCWKASGSARRGGVGRVVSARHTWPSHDISIIANACNKFASSDGPAPGQDHATIQLVARSVTSGNGPLRKWAYSAPWGARAFTSAPPPAGGCPMSG